MKKQILISGMSCHNCVRHVKEALEEVNGVSDIQVNLSENKAVIEVTDQVTDFSLIDAVEKTGYEVTAIF